MLQHVHLARMLDAIALQRAEIVGVAELAAQLLEDLPVALLALGADASTRWRRRSAITRVVVEQRVVDVEQKNGIGHRSRVLRGFMVRAPAGMGRWRSRERNGVTTPVAGSNLWRHTQAVSLASRWIEIDGVSEIVLT